MKQLTRLLVPLVVAVFVVATADSAMAGVARYQFDESDYVLHLPYAGRNYYHSYTVSFDPQDGTYSYSGENLGNSATGPTLNTETVSNWVETETTISFASEYDGSSYSFTFEGITDGSVSWDGEGASNTGQVFTDVTLTQTSHWVTDYTHGEYVAEQGPSAAHSIIGMPVQSKKNKKNK